MRASLLSNSQQRSENTSAPHLLPGEISASSVYRLDEFMRRTGLKTAALRVARRRGLRVYYAHSHGYIAGADWIAYLQSIPTLRGAK